MFYYRPSSRFQGYTSHLPRRSYLPASFDVDDAPSSAFALEDLGHSSLPQSFLPPRINAETRYRRALYELEAAEQEYQAHAAVERARQAAAVRRHVAAEAARREREIALYTEMERINHARALQEQVEEGLFQCQPALRTQARLDRVHRKGTGRVLAHVLNGDAEADPVTRSFEGLPVHSHSQPTPSTCHGSGTSALSDLLGLFAGVQPDAEARVFGGHPARSQPTPSTRRDDGTLNLEDLLGLFAGVHPDRQRSNPPQRPTSPAPLQPHYPQAAEPQAQPHSPKHEGAEVNLSDILEFFHGIAAQARGGVGGERPTHEGLPSQPEAGPVHGKGKGKAKAQPVPEPTLFETLLRERVNGAHDQELHDIEHAIKLSLQDRDATDVKKAWACKASQSSPDASSSKVKVKDPSSSGHAASPMHTTTSISLSDPALEPISPLTTVRAVRTQFSALESAFKFPAVLDFDHAELAVTSNNAPVRVYEHALNGLLERLDAIESDGNEEVRDVRREVVREVERALEEVEQQVKEKAPQGLIPEVTREEAGEVKSEDPGASATEDVPPAVAEIPEVAKPTLPNPVPVASQADADINVAISAKYQSASPVAESSEVAIAGQDSGAGTAPANKEASTPRDADTEDVPASEDASDSIITITPARVTPAVPVPSPLNESASTLTAAAETFLTSLSHDPRRPGFSQSSTNSGASHGDDPLVVDNSSEGGSLRGVEDEWTTEF